MNVTDIIIIAVVVLIVALSGLYVYFSKKKGNKCIGCPHGASCCSRSSCKDGCACGDDKEQ